MKKKICIFNRCSQGAEYGIGTYITQLIMALEENKFSFCIINLFSDEKECKIEYINEYQIINIPSFNHLYLSKKNSLKYYSRNVGYLLKSLMKDDKDTIYIFHLNYMDDEYFARILKQLFYCKIILVAHYTDWSFSLLGNYAYLKKIFKRPIELLNGKEKELISLVKKDIQFVKSVDLFVCVAQHSREIFRYFSNIPFRNIKLINNAIKDSYMPLSTDEICEIKNKYYINKDEKIILFVGRLEEVKGLSYLIEAFKIVLNDYPNSHLYIAGEGYLNNYMKEIAGYWSKITFMGKLDKHILYELYSISDIGVVCSLHEEFGFVAIEMMMHELPIVVTKTGGLNEIVEDNISGLKVPVILKSRKRCIDSIMLADKIKFMLNNLLFTEKIGKKGRIRFLNKYEFSLFSKKMTDLYNNL